MSVIRSRAPARIALLYVVLVSLWFGVSNLLYFNRPDFPPQLVPVQIMRNVAYVVISATALYVVLRREFQSRTAAEAQLSNILDTAADAIITIDEQQQIQLFNQAAERLFDYRAADVLKQPLDRLIPSPSVEAHRHHIESFALAPESSRDMGQRRQVAGRRRDGTEFPAEASISKLKQPGGTSFTVIIRDIGERVRTDRALQESEARYRSIIEAMSEGVVFQDAAGRIQACNASAERILGLSADQLVGRTSFDARWQAIHEDGAAFPGEEHPATVTLQTGRPMSNVVMGVGTPDQPLTWMSVNAQPLIHVGEAKPYAVVVTFADITARKQAEHALQLTEARYRSGLEQRVAERTRELAALLDIARNFAATLDIKPLLRLMLSGIQTVVDYSHALTFVITDDRTAMYDVQIADVDRVSGVQPTIPAVQFAAMLAVGREPLLVPDVTTDSLPAQLYRQAVAVCLGDMARSIRAWLWVPLLVKGQLIGGVSLARRGENVFNVHHLELASTIVNLAAISIENARLVEQAQDLAALQERQRLARELHDAVTQQLFSASLIAEVLPQLYADNPAEGREYLGDIRRLTRGALAEMRSLLMELRPAALTDSSLADLLRQLADAYTGRTGVPIAIKLADQPSPPTDVKVALYRIAQEALNNVAKHARAQHIALQLSGETRTITLRVSDDGRGFDPAVAAPDRFGLGIMRERAQAIGAQLSIESAPGLGTTVMVIWTDHSIPR